MGCELLSSRVASNLHTLFVGLYQASSLPSSFSDFVVSKSGPMAMYNAYTILVRMGGWHIGVRTP